jgi:hypothetical protein
MSYKRLYAWYVAAGLLILAAVGIAQEQRAKKSDKEMFFISYESELQPISINRIHNWVVHVESPDGSPVDDATVTLVGGMPVHDHGLPTLPQATQNLGNGDYLVEGMKFHMNGWWQVTISITVNSRSDVVTFDLQL